MTAIDEFDTAAQQLRTWLRWHPHGLARSTFPTDALRTLLDGQAQMGVQLALALTRLAEYEAAKPCWRSRPHPAHRWLLAGKPKQCPGIVVSGPDGAS